MITGLIWTTWTWMSTVPIKAVKLYHTFSLRQYPDIGNSFHVFWFRFFKTCMTWISLQKDLPLVLSFWKGCKLCGVYLASCPCQLIGSWEILMKFKKSNFQANSNKWWLVYLWWSFLVLRYSVCAFGLARTSMWVTACPDIRSSHACRHATSSYLHLVA